MTGYSIENKSKKNNFQEITVNLRDLILASFHILIRSLWIKEHGHYKDTIIKKKRLKGLRGLWQKRQHWRSCRFKNNNDAIFLNLLKNNK